MQQLLLRDLIESKIHLGKLSAKGFRHVRCAKCNDHSERAGFLFDGDVVVYNCFNCQTKAKHEEHSSAMSGNMRYVLKAFGVTDNEIDEVLGTAFFNKSTASKDITLESLKPQVSLFTPEVPLPPKSFLLGSAQSPEFQKPLIDYLESRCLDYRALKAYFSLDTKYLNRVILPCMRDGKIIFWQARTITNAKPRYISPGTNKDAVLWGYDELRSSYGLPLFITEGIFDAASIDGIALLGSTISEAKLQILQQTRRRICVVIDRDDNGGRLAQLALSYGWEITFPPKNAKDANDSVKRFGKLFTLFTLMRNMTVPTGLKTANGSTLQSQLLLNLELAKLGKNKGGL